MKPLYETKATMGTGKNWLAAFWWHTGTTSDKLQIYQKFIRFIDVKNSPVLMVDILPGYNVLDIDDEDIEDIRYVKKIPYLLEALQIKRKSVPNEDIFIFTPKAKQIIELLKKLNIPSI